MRYRDIIDQMKRDGHHYEADRLQRSVERSGSTWQSVHSRHDARDGLPFISYSGDCAERAYDEIKSEEWRDEMRREDERREQERQERQERERLEYQRMEEERQEFDAELERRQQEESEQAAAEQAEDQLNP